MKIIVIGGGAIGASSAYYLSRAGHEVSVVERGRFGMGCSHGNCGFICPSHVLPLTTPGAWRAGVKSLFNPRSPFRVKPRWDPSLWGWLWRFTRRCNRADMLEAGRAMQLLLGSARRLYDELMRDEPFDAEWETRGVLFVFQHGDAFERYAETDRLLREQFHFPAERLSGPALTEREPALKPGLAGAWYYRGDGHLRPDKLMASWQRILQERGVTIHEDCEVKSFTAAGGRAQAVVTSRGDLPADAFVVATGAWTPFLNQHLGCRIPIQPGKGYSITMARPARCPTHPLIFEEEHVAVTPFRSGYRLGSTMEFAGYDRSLDRRRLDYLVDSASIYLHEPTGQPVEEEWFGWRPMTFDGKPIIDRSPALHNVLIAAGHNMLGMATAPATGKLVAELLGDERPHLDVGAFAVSRF